MGKKETCFRYFIAQSTFHRLSRCQFFLTKSLLKVLSEIDLSELDFLVLLQFEFWVLSKFGFMLLVQNFHFWVLSLFEFLSFVTILCEISFVIRSFLIHYCHYYNYCHYCYYCQYCHYCHYNHNCCYCQYYYCKSSNVAFVF